MVWWHILWWAAFAFGGSCCFRAAEEYPMLYCVQCCCCRVHFVNNQPADYTETICMHFVCTNVLRNIICSVQCTKPLYICNVCERHSVQCTKNQNGGLLSARCIICVCELPGDLQTLPPAVTQSCLRWASSAPALQGGGTLRELWNHQTNSSWAAVVPVRSHWGFVTAVVAFGKRNLLRDLWPFAFRLIRY